MHESAEIVSYPSLTIQCSGFFQRLVPFPIFPPHLPSQGSRAAIALPPTYSAATRPLKKCPGCCPRHSRVLLVHHDAPAPPTRYIYPALSLQQPPSTSSAPLANLIPGEGHRIQPRAPEHHHGNPTIPLASIVSVSLGLAYTTLRSIAGRIVPGTFLRAAAASACLTLPLLSIAPAFETHVFVRPALARDGAALPRRRYVGAVTAGSFGGWFVGQVAFPDSKHAASVLAWQQQMRRAAELRMQLALDAQSDAGRALVVRKAMLWLASLDLRRYGGARAARGLQQGMGPPQGAGAQQSIAAQPGMRPQPIMGPLFPEDDEGDEDEDEAPTLPPGTAPHTVAVLDGGLLFMPETDYLWSPRSAEDGLRTLRQHIAELQDERAHLAKEAEYVWLELAKKEHAYYREQDDDDGAREVQRRALNLLDSIHHSHWRRISDIDWMLANSKKNMRQIEAMQAGDGQAAWLPRPQALAGSVHSPELTRNCIRSHLEGTKHVIGVLEEVASSPNTPEEARKRVNTDLEDVRVSLKATEALLNEFEEKVQEADRNGDGLS